MPYALLFLSCFGLILSFVGLNSTTFQHYDDMSVLWMNQQHSTILTGIAAALSLMGGLPAVLLMSTFASIFFKKRNNTSAIVLIVFGVIGSALIGWLLKFAIDRPRPDFTFALVESYGASFPSAHSVYAATLACLCILLLQKHQHAGVIFIFSSVWWISMGVSRVYLGVHYPTDVLAGWSIGFLWVSILWLLLPQVKLLKNKYFRL